jgi:hypothetical protein
VQGEAKLSPATTVFRKALSSRSQLKTQIEYAESIEFICRVMVTHIMKMFDRRMQLIAVALMLLTAAPAWAHHEAMFGPQSSAVLSPGMFLSAQAFHRENGLGDFRHRETTAVFSAGVRPFKTNPVSFAVVIPITRESFSGLGSTTRWEDPLLSARYRINADRVAKALHVQESYVMVVGGLEVPLGNKDHASGHGPLGEIVAGLFSVEKRPIAGITYAYYHHTGQYANGTRQSGNVFTGGGIAYTPIDNDLKGHLFSLQLGLSYERTFPVEELGQPLPDSGSHGVFMHPGIVFSTNTHMQFFTLVSLPLTQTYNSIDDRQLFRVGVGTILILAHSAEPPPKVKSPR